MMDLDWLIALAFVVGWFSGLGMGRSLWHVKPGKPAEPPKGEARD